MDTAQRLTIGEVAHRVGITNYKRTPALNERPQFMDALADIVREHLAHGQPYGPLYRTRCPGCENPQCRQIARPVRVQPASVTPSGAAPGQEQSRAREPSSMGSG